MKPPPTAEEITADCAKKQAARERKKAEEAAWRALEELQLENEIAEFMDLLTPHLSHAEINRVIRLAGSFTVQWRCDNGGFDYQGQHYGGDEEFYSGVAEKQASTLPPDGRSDVAVDDPTPSSDDLGDIPAEIDRRSRAKSASSSELFAKLEAELKSKNK